MANPAARLPAPLVLWVRSRTVAKVDSIAFVDRRWIRSRPPDAVKVKRRSLPR